MSSNPRARDWVVVINNWTPEEEKLLRDLETVYTVCGHEVGANGTPHLQAYIYMKNAKSFNVLRAYFNNRAHIEPARGNAQHNRKYSTKDGDFWEQGTMPAAGKRTDIAAYVSAVASGASDVDLIQDHPGSFCRYYKAADRIRKALLQEKNKAFKPVSVQVYWGPAGSGKSRRAREIDPDLYVVPLTDQHTLWWDGYDGQKTILFDDFYGNVKYSYLLNLLDGYPFQLPIKGGFTWKAWETVIITSNEHPEAWYKQGLTAALKRRLSAIIHITGEPTSEDEEKAMQTDDEENL